MLLRLPAQLETAFPPGIETKARRCAARHDGIVPTGPNLAPWSPLSRPLLAACGGGLRPVLTAAVRGVTLNLGRDEETAPRVQQRNYARCQTFFAAFSRRSSIERICGVAKRVAVAAQKGVGVTLWTGGAWRRR